MNFEESDHIRMLRDTLKRFLEAEYSREEARRLDKIADYPREAFKKLVELGITGLTIPEEYGGTGVDILSAIVAIEELSRRGGGLTGPFIHCSFYGAMNILENGTEEQKRTFLPQFARGETLFAYGLSEPDVGGDLASARVTANLDESTGKITINGTKRWVTGARIADYVYTLVRSGKADEKYKNLSFVLVPLNSDGISIQDIDHMGLRYAATTDVIFDDVEVPIDNIVGGMEKWNKGWPMLAGRALDVEKLEITAYAFGVASAAVEDAWQYAQERKQFDRPICAHQSVRHTLVEARTKLEACRFMLYRAAWLASEGINCSVESSMAKLFIADTGVEIVLACQQVMGAYGCASEYDMERYVRDIVCMPIVGGSSNMQKNNIANRLGLPTR